MTKLSHGLIQIYTGSGKGKTTAAIGLANRAIANNLKVVFIQFLKSYYDKGAITQNPKIKYFHFGLNYQKYGWLKTNRNKEVLSHHLDKFQKCINNGWSQTKKIIKEGKYDLIILDELNLTIHFKILNLEEIINVLQNRPKNTEILITGRKAPKKLIKISDLVTEMKEIKHPYQKGILARKGIDF